jgi:hypothetical protein
MVDQYHGMEFISNGSLIAPLRPAATGAFAPRSGAEARRVGRLKGAQQHALSDSQQTPTGRSGCSPHASGNVWRP